MQALVLMIKNSNTKTDTKMPRLSFLYGQVPVTSEVTMIDEIKKDGYASERF